MIRSSKRAPVVVAALAALTLSACAGYGSAPTAVAELKPASGSQVSGTVSFYQSGDKLRAEARLSGLKPGEHGFHIHEVGDCSAPDATSAKGHFNPTSSAHGKHGGGAHHAGDMPSLIADAQGNASASFELPGMGIGSGIDITGRGIIVHADPDDYKTQPTGNSGARVACGVIAKR